MDGLSSTSWQLIRPGGEGDALNAVAGETVSLIALLAVLAWAVTRPRGWPEAVAAAPAAVILIAAGAVPAGQAAEEARRLGPVIGFLAAILVLAHLCDEDGLFRAFGGWMARASAGSPRRLLAQVFLVASVTTAVLSLDATVVLLTPVVFATAARLEARARPHVYACTHLANSASLLLPVSNLTNLLAFAASGLAFGRFAALMAVPWLAAIGVEYAVFGRFFGSDLNTGGRADPGRGTRLPRVTLVVVGADAGRVRRHVGGGRQPRLGRVRGGRGPGGPGAGPAHGGSRRPGARRRPALPAVRAGPGHRGQGGDRQRARPGAGPAAAGRDRAARAARHRGTGRGLANVCNNLPAVLVLLPLAAPSGAGAVLAVLVGVNIGPNLTYTGSLATLLWRRIARRHGSAPDLGEFTRLGLLTVPAALVLGVLALWAGLHILGG